VLKFVTSVSRAPLQGFAALKPSFTIRESGLAQDRLPTASTCVNMLKLPRYETKEKLKSKLMFVVTAGAGFDLS
jgi:ubiquitin-protein ligase E3 C